MNVDFGVQVAQARAARQRPMHRDAGWRSRDGACRAVRSLWSMPTLPFMPGAPLIGERSDRRRGRLTATGPTTRRSSRPRSRICCAANDRISSTRPCRAAGRIRCLACPCSPPPGRARDRDPRGMVPARRTAFAPHGSAISPFDPEARRPRNVTVSAPPRLRQQRAGDRQEARLVLGPYRRAVDRQRLSGFPHHQRVGEIP